jgi:DNA (cytosine-5)-methyltransferase 1
VARKKFTVVSLFCGLGGLDLGFMWAGFQAIWANELRENAARSYAENSGLVPVTGDIQRIPTRDIPDADVIIGGPPCQSFSLVGMRRQGDERGQLIFRFRDIVLQKRPKAFVMENVPGMAASRIDGKRLTAILAADFEAAGYRVSVVKLKASDFMVPQRRTRIFILGSMCTPIEVRDARKFASECYGIDVTSFDISAAAAIGDLGPCVRKGEMARYGCAPHSEFARLMRRGNGDTVSLHECPRMSPRDMEFAKHIPPGGNYRDIPDAISTNRIMKFKRTGGRTTTYGRLHSDRPAYTINTYFRRPNVGSNFHYSEQRLITPREAMRFQCFPDAFVVHYSSQDERNTYIGNAVPSLLAHAVAWSVRNSLEG